MLHLHPQNAPLQALLSRSNSIQYSLLLLLNSRENQRETHAHFLFAPTMMMMVSTNQSFLLLLLLPFLRQKSLLFPSPTNLNLYIQISECTRARFHPREVVAERGGVGVPPFFCVEHPQNAKNVNFCISPKNNKYQSTRARCILLYCSSYFYYVIIYMSE